MTTRTSKTSSPAATSSRTSRGMSARSASGKRCVPAPVSISTPPWRLQIVGPPGGDDPAVVDDHDVVAHQLDLREQVRVEQDGGAARAQLLEQRPDDAPAGRVERARRLVEQQEPRRADQRLRDPEPLLHALRHRRHPRLARVPRGRPARAARRARRRRRASRRGAGAASSSSSALIQPGKRKSSAR